MDVTVQSRAESSGGGLGPGQGRSQGEAESRTGQGMEEAMQRVKQDKVKGIYDRLWDRAEGMAE